jgi:hypothetical protein
MKLFLYRLISPRPTFPQDMTEEEEEEEGRLMQEHVAYWRDLVAAVIATVPTNDPTMIITSNDIRLILNDHFTSTILLNFRSVSRKIKVAVFLAALVTAEKPFHPI